MSKLSISFIGGQRLDIALVKPRIKQKTEPLIPSLSTLRRVRRGNKISRFFSLIAQHNKFKRILGTNLAVALMASSIIPTTTNFSVEAETSIITPDLTDFKTERSIKKPTQTSKISQRYSFFHQGIDYDGETGDPIYAIMKGEVIQVQYSRFSYGNTVIIDHGDGVESLYAHLSKIETKEGRIVAAGEKIGEMGSTGRSTGDHLHFEIHFDGKAINPESILPAPDTL